MKRWTHGHTFATGLAGGLLLDRHSLYLFLAGLVLGATLVYFSRRLRSIAHGAAEHARRVQALAVERMEAETERKRAAAAEARTKAEQQLRRRDEQARAERKAYIEGYADGGHA